MQLLLFYIKVMNFVTNFHAILRFIGISLIILRGDVAVVTKLISSIIVMDYKNCICND